MPESKPNDCNLLKSAQSARNTCHKNIPLGDLKFANFQYNTLGRWVDGTNVPPSDGQIIILIDWE